MIRPPLTVRRAGLEEADLIADLGARTFSAAFAVQNRPEDMAAYLAESFSPETVRRQLANPDWLFLIGLDGENVIGYAALRKGEVPACVRGPAPVEIVRIYVEPGCIGGGYGSTMMQACLKEASDEGHATVWLGVWEHNARAIEFYTRWGFEAVGSHTFVLGSDPQNDIIMQRDVVGKAP
ncbi:MAG: GNAT family N-acetyltransferase [Gammaproteobacteria bacterium]|nr:GNAT family N-acetyltransferase [Gammaproteobacteria bacterium]NIR84811.1 GNAT family N-acetyltransferase [Gammaproteobacteria bacterium]NIR91525.1 GNAT family N-acetyltransferase [Gammaproteobacteria bacterium]NIU05858.1 GNAT family N-acetyltransferase [Gammaproteobacteria bacterium]NIV76713.1 GNAT family N-acetyltransferase [Gammaproteobacteria bacterium]